MGILVTIIWILSASATAATKLSLGWTDMRPGGSRSMLLSQSNAGWELDVQDSELAPSVKGVGRFTLADQLPSLSTRIAQLDQKLKLRAQLLDGLAPKNEHALYGRLNQHVVDLDGKFGEELRGILQELLALKWQPFTAHTVAQGKIQPWLDGKALKPVLPAQTLECRWDNRAWVCQYPEGLLQFSKVTP